MFLLVFLANVLVKHSPYFSHRYFDFWVIPDKLHILLSDSSSQDSRVDILIEILGFYLRILLDGILLEEGIGLVQMRHGVGESAVDVEGYQLDLTPWTQRPISYILKRFPNKHKYKINNYN